MATKSDRDSGAWEFGIIAFAAVLIFGYLYDSASRVTAGSLAVLAGTLVTLLAVTGALTWWWRSLPPVRIRRSWPLLVRGLGLAQTQKAHVPNGNTLKIVQVEVFPKIRLRGVRNGWRVTVKLLPGQTPEQYGKHLEAFTHQ